MIFSGKKGLSSIQSSSPCSAGPVNRDTLASGSGVGTVAAVAALAATLFRS